MQNISIDYDTCASDYWYPWNPGCGEGCLIKASVDSPPQPILEPVSKRPIFFLPLLLNFWKAEEPDARFHGYQILGYFFSSIFDLFLLGASFGAILVLSPWQCHPETKDGDILIKSEYMHANERHEKGALTTSPLQQSAEELHLDRRVHSWFKRQISPHPILIAVWEIRKTGDGGLAGHTHTHTSIKLPAVSESLGPASLVLPRCHRELSSALIIISRSTQALSQSTEDILIQYTFTSWET